MKIDLLKVHGSENDFFLIDETKLQRSLKDQEIDQLRICLCDKETGLLQGADGLLIVSESMNNNALAKMRVFNRDGSEASMCGNGLRTVARYLSERENQSEFLVETNCADLKVGKAETIGLDIPTYKVEISPVSFDVTKLPMDSPKTDSINEIIPELSEDIRFSVVSVPNPHLIGFVDRKTLFSETFERIATYVNGQNKLFPNGINVSFVERIAKDQLFVRTFERGVGFTNACGTAMSASSLMHVLLNDGKLDEEITVKNPGGLVKTIVHKSDTGNYWMELIGNATVTFKITGTLTDFYEKNVESLTVIETCEQKNYLEFIQKLKK